MADFLLCKVIFLSHHHIYHRNFKFKEAHLTAVAGSFFLLTVTSTNFFKVYPKGPQDRIYRIWNDIKRMASVAYVF